MLKLRHRSRLRQKEVSAYAKAIETTLGCANFSTEQSVDRAEAEDGLAVLLLGDEVFGLIVGDRPTLAVRGLLKWTATKHWVTVDMGAVPYVANGADIMAPGIVDADPGIAVGDLVWIRDERNKRPLAVGEAILDAAGMVEGKSGKAIRSIHYVGDKLWLVGTEPE
jgi:PUA domain protein